MLLSWLIRQVQRLRWTIFTKILVSFSLILVLLVLTGGLIFGLEMNSLNLDEQADHKSQVVNQLQTLNSYLENENNLFSTAIFVYAQGQLNDNFGGQIIDLSQQLKEQSASFSPDGLGQFRQFQDNYREVLVNAGSIRGLVEAQKFDEARQTWPTLATSFNTTKKSLQSLIKTETQTLQALNNYKREAVLQSLFILLACGLLITGLGSLLALVLSRSIGEPLRLIKAQLDQIAHSNLIGTIQLDNQDELGAVATMLNQATANLRQMVSSSRISGELSLLSENLNLSSREQAGRANEQLCSVTQIVGAMQELSNTTRLIADNTVVVANASRQTSERIAAVQQIAVEASNVSDSVGSVAESTVNLVGVTLEAVEELGGRLEELADNATQIRQVVDIITNIAAEVHLLALNAAIEAAGAGQYGDRFNVIAQQVKNLAGRARHATSQVEQLVNQVQSAVGTASQQLDVGRSKVELVLTSNHNLGQEVNNLSTVVNEAVTAVGAIVEAARQVDVQAHQIQIATRQQESSSIQIVTSLKQIGEMAQENNASSHQLAVSTERLDQLSAHLNQTLAAITFA